MVFSFHALVFLGQREANLAFSSDEAAEVELNSPTIGSFTNKNAD